MLHKCPVCNHRHQPALGLAVVGARLYHEDYIVKLTPGEANCFEAILRRHPEAATRDNILDNMYRNDNVPEWCEKTVDVYICRLRKKIRKLPVEIVTYKCHGEYSLREKAS